jgi:hypothetical protein
MTIPADGRPSDGAAPPQAPRGLMRERANGFVARRSDMAVQLADPSAWLRDLGISLCIGLFLGVIGPFGSFLNTNPAVRIAYWTGSILAGTVMLRGILWLLFRLRGQLAVPDVAIAAAAALLGSLPIAAQSRALALALWPEAISHVPVLAWYGQALCICLPISLVYELLNQLRRPACALAEPMRSGTGNFLDRLPPHLGRELIALQMEDHYVRAHTARGSALILIPLHQAIAELSGLPGLRVHRSWWVARRAVEGFARDGRNYRLLLANGVQAPVSRASVAPVRAAGLLG